MARIASSWCRDGQPGSELTMATVRYVMLAGSHPQEGLATCSEMSDDVTDLNNQTSYAFGDPQS